MAAVAFGPLLAVDVDAAARIAVIALAPSTGSRPEPGGARLQRMRARIEHARLSDPGGAWLAWVNGQPVGVALALRSDGVWALSLLAVDPGAQSAGIGRGLLERALTYAEGCRSAFVASSLDPRAMRLYGRAGFELRPAVAADGIVDRAALHGADAVGVSVREAGADELGRTAAIDRAVRGGARVEQLALLLALPDARLYLAGDRDARGGRDAPTAGDTRCDGYALGRQGRLFTVAARDERCAQALLRRLLADAFDGPDPGHAIAERITSGQDWAVEVLLQVGLRLRSDGPIFTRGDAGPLRPYLPTGPYF